MRRRMTKRASYLLNGLPVAHSLMRILPAPHVMAVAAVVRRPIVRRFVPGLHAMATVGGCVCACVIRQRPEDKTPVDDPWRGCDAGAIVNHLSRAASAAPDGPDPQRTAMTTPIMMAA